MSVDAPTGSHVANGSRPPVHARSRGDVWPSIAYGENPTPAPKHSETPLSLGFDRDPGARINRSPADSAGTHDERTIAIGSTAKLRHDLDRRLQACTWCLSARLGINDEAILLGRNRSWQETSTGSGFGEEVDLGVLCATSS